jgi:hypothetical protein
MVVCAGGGLFISTGTSAIAVSVFRQEGSGVFARSDKVARLTGEILIQRHHSGDQEEK